MITKKDKAELLDAIKGIDVKKMEVEHEDERITKWYRFGNFNALQLVSELIKDTPEKDEGSVS